MEAVTPPIVPQPEVKPGAEPDRNEPSGPEITPQKEEPVRPQEMPFQPVPEIEIEEPEDDDL